MTLTGGCLVGACGTAHRSSADGLLQFPGGPLNPGLGEAISVEPDSYWLMGSIPLCPSSRTPVVVDSVRPRDGDLEVSAFLIRDNPEKAGGTLLGDARGDLPSHGLAATPEITLDRPCGERAETDFYELVIELHASDHDTSAAGFSVHYTSGDAQGVLDVAYEAHSCASRTTPACQDLPAPPFD